MDPRKRFSDPLATTEKQTVSFLNERQGIVRYQERNNDIPDGNNSLLHSPRIIIDRVNTLDQHDQGQDVPDGALSSLPHQKEPKNSILKRESSRATREVKFEAHLNNARNVKNYQSRELELDHNNLDPEDSDEELNVTRRHFRANSTISASAMSIKSNRSSVSSYHDDDLKLTTNLTVLKIIFVDIFFSLGDHLTDFLQGFNLMFGDALTVSMAEWKVDSQYWGQRWDEHWEQRGQYGLIVLLLNWSPGIIAVVHMLAYHRKEYAVQETSLMLKTLVPGVMDFKTKREHQIQRRRKFFLSMILVLIFYPFIPAVTYILLLWSWGNGNAQPEALSRRENFAMVAHSITGGFEAPVQLTMTIWLMLKGIIDNDFSFAKAFVDFGLPTDKFGNTVPLPAIPVISSLTSLLSIMFACVRLNIPQPYQSYREEHFWKRHSKRFSKVMGHLPFFLCSVLFRVMSYAFMWVFLSGSIIYSSIPLICTFLANLVIGYNQQTDSHMKKEMKSVRKKIKKHLKETNQEQCKYRRIELAVWLSSFIGIFIPCCYSQQLEDKIVNKLSDKHELLKTLDEIRENFQKRVLKRQELAGTLINFISCVVIFMLVNYTDTYKYADNKLTNFSFNIYFYVVSTLGLMCLTFTLLNFDALHIFNLGHTETKGKTNITVRSFDEPDGAITLPDAKKNLKAHNPLKVKVIEQKTNKFVQFLVSVLFCFLVLTPILFGGYYNYTYTKPDGFAILVPDPAALENEMNMTMVKINPVNNYYKPKNMEGTIGRFIKCEDFFSPSFANKKRKGCITYIVYADLRSHECWKHLIDKEKFEKEMDSKVALLIAENFQHRSSSSFPLTIFDDTSDTFLDKSISHLKTFNEIPILSFNKMDRSVFESGIEAIENQEVRIVMKGIQDLFNPTTSELLMVECNDAECIHLEDGEFEGSEVFLGCDSQPKRNVKVRIECSDRGKHCTEFDRYNKNTQKEKIEKEQSCRGRTITPEFVGNTVALRCKGRTTGHDLDSCSTSQKDQRWRSWSQKKEDLICRDDDNKKPIDNSNKGITCCTSERTTIFATKGCKYPKRNECNWGRQKSQISGRKEWGFWSDWNDNGINRDRSRFCYVDKSCIYVETQISKKNMEKHDIELCGRDDIFNQTDMKCDDF